MFPAGAEFFTACCSKATLIPSKKPAFARHRFEGRGAVRTALTMRLTCRGELSLSRFTNAARLEGFVLASRNVYVVDDDPDVRASIGFMLDSGDLQCSTFKGGEEFVERVGELVPGCVLLDVRMPRMDGFQVMQALQEAQIDWPVIIMTGHGEVPVAVRAMKLGAVDFIEKPFGENVLMASLDRAFLLLKERGEKGESKRLAEEKIARLTAREREVLQGLVGGFSNKLLARHMGLSLRTVEMHRAHMMERLQVGSLAEALAMALQVGLPGLEKPLDETE